ncbi:flagellar protein FliJ [Desulfitobacterium sp. Sab5]|uniref:flagellar FliJ family protein n=1 Tax=Desulfitobacterium nosdiversum TaxID=3375356 RepID=UPI003CE85F21
MPRFKFRLEAALKLAERELDNERRRLAVELEQLRQVKNAACKAEEEWQGAIQNQKEAGMHDPENLGRWQAYAVSRLKRLRELQKELEEQEKRVEAQRVNVIEAHKNQEKLKKLKEKKKAAFWLKEQHREQNLLDEAGQIIFMRQREEQEYEVEDEF